MPPLKGHWQCLETCLVVIDGGREDVTGIKWVDTREVFNILQCPGQPPATKNDLAENVSRPSVDVPCCRAPVPAS